MLSQQRWQSLLWRMPAIHQARQRLFLEYEGAGTTDSIKSAFIRSRNYIENVLSLKDLKVFGSMPNSLVKFIIQHATDKRSIC